MSLSSVIGALRVDLGIETANFKKGLDEAKSKMGEFVEKLKMFGEAAIAALALEKVAEAISATVENMDKLGKAAQKVGLPVEDFTKFAFAAKLSELTTEDFSLSLVKLAKNMDAAANGRNGNVAAAFQAVGVSMRDANGHIKSLDQVLPQIADRFSKTKDSVEKTSVAVALFGKAGAEMIPLLDDGAKGFQEAADKAEQMGLVISGPAAEAAKKLNESWITLKATGEGFLNRVLTPFLPIIANVVSQFVDWANSCKIAEFAAKGLVIVLKSIASAFVVIGETAYAAGQVITETFNAASDLALGRFGQLKKDGVDAFDHIKDRILQTKHALEGLWDDHGDQNVARLPKLNMADPAAIASANEAHKKAIDTLKAHREEVNKFIQSLRIKDEQYTRSHLLMQIDENLQKAGKYATDDQRASIRNLTIELAKHQAAMQTVAQEAQNYADKQKKFTDELAKVADWGSSAMQSWIDGTKSLTSSMGDLLGSIEKLALNAAFKQLLGGMFGGDGSESIYGGGGGGGIFSQLLGKFAGSFADGGTIPSGKFGIVGEGGGMQHAELVAGPASVIPMSQMGGGGTNIHIDARGADAGQIAMLRQELHSMTSQLGKTVRGIVSNEKRANPRAFA